MQHKEIQRVSVMRNMLRDLAQCNDFDKMCLLVGLTPSGPDVDTKEHLASHNRIDAVQAISSYVGETAEIAGELMLRVNCATTEEKPDEDDYQSYRQLSRAVCIATVLHLVDRGVLEVPE